MDEEDIEFYRWFGPWAPLEPPEVAELFARLEAPWWVVGGWAIDAFTGRPRVHEDIDVAFFRADLPLILDRLVPDYCVWSNLSGTLRPLKRPEDLLDGCRQLWVRRDGASPWLIDLAMTPHDGGTWISVRDERVRMPLDEATFEADGIRYLRPEIVLSFKLKRQRHDDGDFDTALPMLDTDARAALRAAIELYHPGHPWLDRMITPADG
jgi:Aminoglycoside-2''-adenylyltransferase